MSKIAIHLDHPIIDGEQITFRSPCASEDATGLKIYTPTSYEDATEISAVFTIKDATGTTLHGKENVFASGSYVTVAIDTTNGFAYLHNGATDAGLQNLQKQIIASIAAPIIAVLDTNGPDLTWVYGQDLYNTTGAAYNDPNSIRTDFFLLDSAFLRITLPNDLYHRVRLCFYTAASEGSFVQYSSKDITGEFSGSFVSVQPGRYCRASFYEYDFAGGDPQSSDVTIEKIVSLPGISTSPSNGSYVLKATVTNGIITYSWVSEST